MMRLLTTMAKYGTPSVEDIRKAVTLEVNTTDTSAYGEFPEDRIREMVTVQDMDAEDMAVLKVVIENAKKYFSNPKAFDEAWREEMGNDKEVD